MNCQSRSKALPHKAPRPRPRGWEEQESSVTCFLLLLHPLPAHPKAIGMLRFLQMDHKWHMYCWCALALGEWDCICQLARQQPDLIWKRMVHSCCRNSKEQIFNHPPFLPVQSHPLIGKWEAQSAQIRGKMCQKQPLRQKTEVPTPWYHDLAAVYKSDLANQRVPGRD